MVPRDSIAVKTVVNYEISRDNDDTFQMILEYDDINGNHYKQMSDLRKYTGNNEYYSFESSLN